MQQQLRLGDVAGGAGLELGIVWRKGGPGIQGKRLAEQFLMKLFPSCLCLGSVVQLCQFIGDLGREAGKGKEQEGNKAGFHQV